MLVCSVSFPFAIWFWVVPGSLPGMEADPIGSVGQVVEFGEYLLLLALQVCEFAI